MAQLKDLIVNGASQLISDVKINAKLIDGTGSSGSNGQILLSTGGKIQWGNISEVYTLPLATTAVLGGIKVGYSQSGKNYAVQVDSNGKAYVNVPWSDTNTQTITGVKGGAETSYRTGNVNITATDIGLGQVENTALSTWAGSTNIETIGTLSSGTVPWARLTDIPTGATKEGTVTQVIAGSGLSGGTITTTGTISIAGMDTTSGSTAQVLSKKGTWVDLPTASSLGLSSAMLFKGTVGTGGTTASLPNAAAGNTGHTYKVITAGTFGGQVVKAGDVLVSNGSNWVPIPSGDEPSGTITNIAAGVGLTTASGTAITTTGTLKAKLRNETALSTTSVVATTVVGKVYPVVPDKDGYLSVNVPWTDTNTKQNVTLGVTTKAYLTGVSTAPTSSAQALTAIADSDVYLTATAGQLAAKSFMVTGTKNSTNAITSDAINNIYFQITKSSDTASKAIPLVVTDTAVRPGMSAAGTIDLGTDDYKWKDIYGITFNGDLYGAIEITNTEPTTAISYYLPFISGYSSTAYTLKSNNRFYYYDSGTAEGGVWLNTGKANYKGGVTFHDNGTYYGSMSTTTLTDNRSYILPNATGPIALARYGSTIGSSTSTHAIALKNYFDNNKAIAPRNQFVNFYDNSNGNGSATFGYFLQGYDDEPYGGFFSAHYNTPYYIGINKGTYTQYTLGRFSTNTAIEDNRFIISKGTTGELTAATGLRYFTDSNTASAVYTRLHIYGQTYGNTAATMLSGTAGLFSFGDGGPQITFDTNATPGGSQAGALIYTDHDTAASGASWHFVSNQPDWNVTSKRFHARTGISIGTELPTTTHNLYVAGTQYIQASTTTNSGVTGLQIDKGILKITNYGNTITIGSTNASWNHIYSNDKPFVFNKTIISTDGDLGSSSYPFHNLYLGTTAPAILASKELYIQANNATNALGLAINTSHEILPVKAKTLTNNVGSIGSSSYKWNAMYATTFNGALNGNAATATKWTTAQTVYVALGTASTTSTIQGGSSSAQTIGVNGTLSVANGGTGANQFAVNSVIISSTAATAALTTRAITNNTTDTKLTTASTNIPTVNTVMHGINAAINELDFTKIGGGTGDYISEISQTNGKISATKLTTTVTNAWAHGTTAGPKLTTVVNGITASGAVVPTASTTNSGVVTTGNQTFAGRKTMELIGPSIYDGTGNSSRYKHIYFKNNAGSIVGTLNYDSGDATNVTSGRVYFIEYSPNTTADTATTGFYELYQLPTVTSGRTTNTSYNILTTKSLVSIAQGGTGASSADKAPWVQKSGDTMTGVLTSSYTSGQYVTSLTSAAITLTQNSYGGWICGKTKNGNITIASYPASNDKLYFGYGETGRTANSFVHQMTWEGSSGVLTTEKLAVGTASYGTSINNAPANPVTGQVYFVYTS